MANEKTADRDPFNSRYSSTESEQESETEENSKESKTSKMSETAATSKTQESDESSETVRERKNVNMYLPKGKVEDLQLKYAELNVVYQREFGEEMPKNDVFYPAVIESAIEDKDLKDVLDLKEC